MLLRLGQVCLLLMQFYGIIFVYMMLRLICVEITFSVLMHVQFEISFLGN